ncbi:MAG: arginine--tRNA ligase [Oscillospiraceae bacterium]|nr:arginine--tRNA ligase [Oscillospiraceae bacterium]
MQNLTELLSEKAAAAFAAAGYDDAYGKVTLSNRPDLCEFQCNGAMPAAKQYHCAPIAIAQAVAAKLAQDGAFSSAEAVMPGFINLKLSPAFLSAQLSAMAADARCGAAGTPVNRTVVLDYGGPNVAKPLHIGHLRAAIIGESIKRLYRFFGNTVIGDIHMGDWGLQMGLIIAELHARQPELPYFDPDFTGEYPAEPPFTISELEEIYPAASAKSKEDAAFAAEAHEATRRLQEHERGCYALWKHIMAVSVADLKKNYAKLNVSFDAWLGESDAQPYIEPMLAQVAEKGLARESDGALVVDVQEESDTKELPPCILKKSDGATLYATTDLATILQRERDFRPDKILYVVDKRQSLHFEQVFRVARKASLVRPETELQHIGFGTMNGKDGKPFKTREGGVMRLETLIADITDFVRGKITENQQVADSDVDATAQMIALAALKYGDLSNQATKDYVFDLDRFAAVEGNTGPYLLYTIVRIKSILAKCGKAAGTAILPPVGAEEKSLGLTLARFGEEMENAYRDSAPHAVCAYLYELAGAVNKFYHETKIVSEPDEERQAGYLALIDLAQRMLETGIDLLGFRAPEKM